MYDQLARVALELTAKASIPATDENLAAVIATRNMLRQIAKGELIVTQPGTPESNVVPIKAD